MYSLNQRQLMDRLEMLGITRSLIPGFVRILASSLFIDPEMGLSEVNKRLQYLGWDDFELDDHTLQLAIACFEAEGINPLATLSTS